ncbi:MAG: glycoside hydrolase family 32 protein, partial [Marinoscillum sp.]
MKFQSTLLVGLLIIQACHFKQKTPGTTLDSTEIDNSSSYHFEPTVNWMNDPNGMVYYAGEYHLFYQHFPDSNVWGPMHWGHAVSEDLIHWKHLPIALYPDSLGFVFSGSAVVDHENTSGLGSKENPPLVAVYTYSNQKEEFEGSITFQNQAIAFSLDSGRSWKKYSGNPVINNPGIKDFRDPKVSWVEEYQMWVMVLAVKDHVSVYSSKDLIDWTHESDFGESLGAHGGVWECPDLFKIKNDKGEEHWVMLVSINPGGLQG